MKQTNRIVAALLALIITAACAKAVGDTVDDASLTTRVKTAFVNDPVVGVERIDVDTFKGVVTLSGQVKTKEAEAKAIELAKTIRGVTDVKSNLKIGQ